MQWQWKVFVAFPFATFYYYILEMGHKSAVPAKPKDGDRSTLTPAQKKGELNNHR